MTVWAKKNHPRLERSLFSLFRFKLISLGKSNSGFTLIELMVVIIIVGILSTIIGASWLDFIRRQRLRTATDRVYSAITEARNQARNTQLPWQVAFRQQNADSPVEISIHPQTAYPNEILWQPIEVKDIKIPGVEQTNGYDLNFTNFQQAKTSNNQVPLQRVVAVLFNYQGCPVLNAEDGCAETELIDLSEDNTRVPRLTLAVANRENFKSCLVLSTMLGSVRTDQGENCTN